MKRIAYYVSSPWFLPIVISLIVLTCAYAPARAEEREALPSLCGDAQEIAAHLASKYNETMVAMGVGRAGTLLQIYATPDGDTWTALSISPHGPACVVGAGRNWQAVPATEGDIA